MRDHTQDNLTISPGDPYIPAPTPLAPRTFESWLGRYDFWKADVHDESAGTRRIYLPIRVVKTDDLLPLGRFYFDVHCEKCNQILYRASAHPKQDSVHHISRAYEKVSEHAAAHQACLCYRWVHGR